MQPALASGIDKSRYELLTKIASGGMGTVYVARLRGAAGFRRLVAVKRAHPHLVEQKSFAKMLLKEAHLASLISHPNAVSVMDVEELEGELLLVMDYVDGVPLSALITALDPDEGDHVPAAVAVRILLDIAAGLHACHTATDEDGEELGLVHRDVSPQNILVGADGQSRLTDFGIAKSLTQDDKLTQTGGTKGKSGYMAPEYALDGDLDRRSDVFGLGVVMWETLSGQRLFRGATQLDTLRLLTETDAAPVSEVATWLSDGLDHVIAVALERDPNRRFDTAEAFGHALELAARKLDLVARHREVGELVRKLFGDSLEERRRAVRVGATLAPGTATAPHVVGEQVTGASDVPGREVGEDTAGLLAGEPETADMSLVAGGAMARAEPSTFEASTLVFEASRRRRRQWATGAMLSVVGLATIGVLVAARNADAPGAPAATAVSATKRPMETTGPAVPSGDTPLVSGSLRAPDTPRRDSGSAAPAALGTATANDAAASSEARPAQRAPTPPFSWRPPVPMAAPSSGPKSEMSAAPNPFKTGPKKPKTPYDP